MASWERQPGESEEAHTAFLAYMAQPKGERSLRDVSRELAKSVTLLGRWSSRNQWQKRVQMWDEEQLRQTVEAMQEAQRETARQDHERLSVLKNNLYLALSNKDLTEESAVILIDGLERLIKLDRVVLGQDNGGKGGPGAGGSGKSNAPQYIKLYEGVDLSKI